MSLPSDIHWVQNEVAQIRGEHFMAKVKKLLQERPSKVNPMTYEELENELMASAEDIKTGRVHTTEALRTHFKNRLEK